MTIQKRNKTIMAIIILLAMLISVFVWINLLNVDITSVTSETGVWDLRGMSFGNDFYSLDGKVEYIPGALLTPEEFAAQEQEADIGYPQSVSQYATSRIRILLPDDGYYTFSCRSIDYSHRLYVNGEWILDIGSPGDSRETAVPDTGKISLTLKPVDGVIEIVQQASNFVHRRSGKHTVWNVSGSGLRASLMHDFNESMKLGCFLALFFVHIILFLLLRSYRPNLYFALFCLMWFLRTGVTGAKLFTDLFPWMSWAVKFRIEYLTFPVTAVLLISLLNALFPGILHKWFRRFLYGVSAIVAALFLFSDTVFMTYALLWCEAVYIPAILYIVVRFAMKLRSVGPEQTVFLAGVGMFFYGAVHDMFYFNGINFFQLGEISSGSMLLLTFCEAAAVFIATVREMETAKEQEWALTVENAALRGNARMTEMQIVLQREQYFRIAENDEQIKIAHHDLRHQLAVMDGYLKAADLSGAQEYCDKLTKSIPVSVDKSLCDNFAVNAVAAHYLAKAESAGIKTDVRAAIPAKAGRVEDSDLCVIVGNLLENAVEACEQMESGEKTIKLRAHIRYGNLTITVDNSFDGVYTEKDGVFFSRKRTGESEGEGIGLFSVRTVAKKYGGALKCEARGNLFMASVYVKMGDDGESD